MNNIPSKGSNYSFKVKKINTKTEIFNLQNIEVAIHYPKSKDGLLKKIHLNLKKSKNKLSKIFKKNTPFSTKIYLYYDKDFFRITGAPTWTNALYLNNEISLPINSDVLAYSVQHEFTHAYLNTISNANCPAWLDEGIAQWIEKKDRDILLSIYKDWLVRNPTIDFSLLENGFLNLNSEIVGPAYAQSLFAFEALVKNFGSSKIRKYFKLLSLGLSHVSAFRRSFKIDQGQLTKLMLESLKA